MLPTYVLLNGPEKDGTKEKKALKRSTLKYVLVGAAILLIFVTLFAYQSVQYNVSTGI